MIIHSTNEWELTNKSGSIQIGSYSLFISTRGPPRKSGAPVVIFITGGGVPTELYAHLHYAVSKFARNYFYDRAGYGRSGRPGQIEGDSIVGNGLDEAAVNVSSKNHGRKILAEDSATELHQLMRAIKVEPPYVLAAHSYGGIVARTYYGLYPDDIAGLALLDTNSELLQQCLGLIPPPAYQRVTAEVDLSALTHLREASGMSDEEWNAAEAAVERTKPASADEATHESGRRLAGRMQIDRQAMGDKPLLLMKSDMVGDWRMALDEGIKLGGGTEEERNEATRWVETAGLFCRQVQRVQLCLSRNADYVQFEDVGHDFPVRVPKRTAGLVKRLLDTIRDSSSNESPGAKT